MNHASAPIEQTTRSSMSASRRLKRQAAALAARCATASWLVLAAMPIAVVVCALT